MMWKIKFLLGWAHHSTTVVRSQAEGRFTKKMREEHMAKLTLLPEWDACKESIRNGKVSWRDIGKKYPQWLDGLPEPVTADIVAAIQDVWSRDLKALEAKPHKTALQEFQTRCGEFLAGIPLTMRSRGFFQECSNKVKSLQADREERAKADELVQVMKELGATSAEECLLGMSAVNMTN